MSGQTGDTTERATAWTLVAIVLLGLALRGPRLVESLWYDEIAAWQYCGTGGPAEITGSYEDPANHVAHTLLTWYSVTALNDALGPELALRMPALAFSLLGLAAVFALARRCVSTRAALFAAALAAVTPVAVLEGAEARGYSMMICFAAAATGQMLVILEKRRVRHWFLYAVFCAIGIWSHLMTVFVPAGHAAWLAWRIIRRRDDARAAWCGAAAIGIAAVLTLALYAPILGDVARMGRAVSPGGSDARSLLGAEGLHALLQLGGSWYWWAATPGLALALVGGWNVARNERARTAVALSLLCLPAVALAVVVADTWIYARFTLFALPGGLLLMAVGLDAIWSWRRNAGLAAGFVLAVSYGADLLVRPPKQPLRDAASYVLAERGEGERTLVVGLRHMVLDAYGSDLKPDYSLAHGTDLDTRLAETHAVWVILMYPQSVSPDRYELLAQHGYVERQRFDGWVDWTNGDVIVYERAGR